MLPRVLLVGLLSLVWQSRGEDELSLSACDLDAPLSAFEPAARDATDESSFECDSTTLAASSAVPSEGCVCAAMRLGFAETAKRLLHDRMLAKKPSPSVRRAAQAMQDGAVAILARMHQRYPNHLKIQPGIEWAQTEDKMLVRVRYARYTRGEALFQRAERGAREVSWDEDVLRLRVEGDDKPAFIDANLTWFGKVGEEATYASVPGGFMFEARKVDRTMWPRLLAARQPPNRIDSAEGLEVGRLLGCAADCRKGCGWSEGATACAKRCRVQCEGELAAHFAVR